ncbi:MAG: polymer-forming cytoskeletal protein [Proteobacteria bacterium]|nr:polymer-forming cytoskeletal protein [Pseudomonadota bacterium]
MLGGGNKRRGSQMDTLVGHNTKIVGDIHFEGGLHVDGLIEGNVYARDAGSRLSISERGQVQGEVRVPEVMLNGMVKGDVYAGDRIELGIKAKVEGNVYYNLIRMEAGATVNGKLVHKPGGSPVLALKHEQDARQQGETDAPQNDDDNGSQQAG